MRKMRLALCEDGGHRNCHGQWAVALQTDVVFVPSMPWAVASSHSLCRQAQKHPAPCGYQHHPGPREPKPKAGSVSHIPSATRGEQSSSQYPRASWEGSGNLEGQNAGPKGQSCPGLRRNGSTRGRRHLTGTRDDLPQPNPSQVGQDFEAGLPGQD